MRNVSATVHPQLFSCSLQIKRNSRGSNSVNDAVRIPPHTNRTHKLLESLKSLTVRRRVIFKLSVQSTMNEWKFIHVVAPASSGKRLRLSGDPVPVYTDSMYPAGTSIGQSGLYVLAFCELIMLEKSAICHGRREPQTCSHAQVYTHKKKNTILGITFIQIAHDV